MTMMSHSAKSARGRKRDPQIAEKRFSTKLVIYSVLGSNPDPFHFHCWYLKSQLLMVLIPIYDI